MGFALVIKGLNFLSVTSNLAAMFSGRFKTLFRGGKTWQVLLYNDFFGSPLLDQLRGEICRCRFIQDRAFLPQSDAVLFHLPPLRSVADLPRKRPGQIWIGLTAECDLHYPQQKDPAFMGHFDLRMNYHQDSDIPIAYIWPGKLEEYLAPVPPKTESAPAVIFVSNGRPNCRRNELLDELSQWIKIDRYGNYRPNRQLENDRGRASKQETLGRYKFVLAWENAIERDYVSEKFFDGFVSGCVPVYWGAPNVADFAPGDHAYIDVAAYASARDLVATLQHLASHEEDYARYHGWRKQPLRPAFLELYEREWKSPLSRLCETLHNL